MGIDVLDLRGDGGAGGGSSVLADPTGRRRRRLTGASRAMACAVGVWLCGLLGAGLGLLPAPVVPLASFVNAPSAPPRLDRLAHPPASAIVPSATSPALGTDGAPRTGRAFGDRGHATKASSPGRRQTSRLHGPGAPGSREGTALARGKGRGSAGQPAASTPAGAGGLAGTPSKAGLTGRSHAPGQAQTPARSSPGLTKSSEHAPASPARRPVKSSAQTSIGPEGLPAPAMSAPGRSEPHGHGTAPLPTP
jgi:hypothetical protein